MREQFFRSKNTSRSTVTFYSYKATVGQPGTEAFMVNFALYTLDDSGNNQKIYGYFQWDPTITVPQ